MPVMKGEHLLRFLGERRVFLNGEPGPDQVRVIVGEAEDPCSREVVTIKGEAEEGALRVGLIYRFFGRFVQHHKWGDQFHFTATVLETPADFQSVVAYLTSIKTPMLGQATAKRIYETWGNDSITTLIEHPEVVAAKIPRFSLTNAKEAGERLRGKERTRRTTVDLMGLLHGRGLPKKTVEKLIDDYGSEAAAIVRRNPYCLMRYRGCGFLKADRLYMELASQQPPAVALKMAARLKRQALCCWYAIARGSDGHTWYPQAIARQAVAKEISGQDVKFDRAVQLAIRCGMLEERCEMGTRYLAEGKKARAERDIARCIVVAEQETERLGGTCWPSLDGLGLTEHQRMEAEKALRGIVGILGGSPGTGKTFTAAKIIKAIIDTHGSDKIAICGPTGKSAVRVTESMLKNGITKTATTIHSLLSVQSSGDDGWAFEFNEKHPLPYSFIVLDEGSMPDVPIMAALLKARPRGCHLLICGDVNQLAPVGHGAPLRDFISAGIPYGELTEIQRNSGRIVKVCAEIRDKRRFNPSPALDLENGENLVHLERETPEQQIETLEQMLSQFINANPRKYDPVWDIQILVPINKKSPLGRKDLNRKLQDLFNFEGQRVDGNPFRVGDKVICRKNGFSDLVENIHEQPPFETNGREHEDDQEDRDRKNEKPRAYVANGEQGEVVAIEPRRMVVRLTGPDRIVMIPMGGQRDEKEDDGPDKVESDEEKEDDKSTGTGCNYELAYGITSHLSQGSEWKLTIVLIDEHSAASRVQTCNYATTALSRGKVATWTIGKMSVVEQMLRRPGLNRKTFLVETIRELRGPKRIEREENIWTDEFCAELLQGVCP